MMDTSYFKSDWFKAVSAVILGGAANELGHYFADRRERKRSIGRALSDLLEIRVRFIGAEMVIAELGKIFPLSALDQAQARTAFHNLVGGWPQLAQRYNESVTLVASLSPVLAYRLRSKEVGQQIFQIVDMAAASAQQEAAQAHAIWQTQLSPLLSKEVAGTLTDTCRRVAWKHGVLTWWDVRGILKRSTELPPEAKQYLDVVKQLVEQQKKAGNSEPPQTA